MSSQRGWTARPPATGPADELADVLQQLRWQLGVLTGPGCAADTVGHPPAPACLDGLYRYLVEDLTPVMLALAERVRPALRRLGAVGPGWRTAGEHARLLRLTERVAVLRAEYALGGDTWELRDQTVTLVDELPTLATAHLLRAQHTLPTALRGLPPAEAVRIVDATRRTAHIVHDHPSELKPALL